MSDFKTKAQEMLVYDEGISYTLYKCPAGKWTIGVGHNVDDNGLTHNSIMGILADDIKLAEADALMIFGTEFDDWPELVRLGVINMLFNMGRPTFSMFKATIAALKANDWKKAAKHASESKWADQVPNRAARVLKLIANEAWPY